MLIYLFRPRNAFTISGLPQHTSTVVVVDLLRARYLWRDDHGEMPEPQSKRSRTCALILGHFPTLPPFVASPYVGLLYTKATSRVRFLDTNTSSIHSSIRRFIHEDGEGEERVDQLSSYYDLCRMYRSCFGHVFTFCWSFGSPTGMTARSCFQFLRLDTTLRCLVSVDLNMPRRRPIIFFDLR